MAAALAAGLLSGVPPAAAADETIVVEGNKRVDPATVRSYFKSGADGKFDEAARDAGLKALIETRLFDKVSVDRSGEKLIVHVHEAPVLDKVVFEGNKRIKDTELSPGIESKPRGSLQRAMVQSDVNHIIEAYKHLGSLEFSKLLLNEAKVAVSPGIGFGDYGDAHVRFSLIENEERTRQAIRGIKQMLAKSAALVG